MGGSGGGRGAKGIDLMFHYTPQITSLMCPKEIVCIIFTNINRNKGSLTSQKTGKPS